MASEPAAAPLTFKVLTLNTHKGFSSSGRRFVLPELREAVRSVSADVVFLQEVIGVHERHAERATGWPVQPHYEFLADSIWTDYAYGKNAVYPHGHHGNAVLSKFPIHRWHNRDVSQTGPERRGLLHCVVDLPGRPFQLHAICVHLGLMEAHRRAQLHLLCDLIRDEVPADAPVVVAGDFNDWRRRAHPILAEGAGLKEAFVEAEGRAARTFPARFPLLKLDRIYYRGARALRPKVLSSKPWSHLSDHAALLLELEV